MNDLRNNISAVIVGNRAVHNWGGPRPADYKLADAIIAALPDMVAPLVWSKSVIKGWDGDYHTVPTRYRIRCADENGWKLSHSGGFGYYHGPEQAKDAANAHHRAAVVAAITGEQP